MLASGCSPHGLLFPLTLALTPGFLYVFSALALKPKLVSASTHPSLLLFALTKN